MIPLLASALLSTITSSVIFKSAQLNPLQIFDNGVRIMSSINVQNKIDHVQSMYDWRVNVQGEYGWHFIISLDDSYGFDYMGRSAIELTINGPSDAISIDSLYFGFTTSANQAKHEYVAVEIPMSEFFGPAGFSFWSKSYPQCGSTALAKGIALCTCLYTQKHKIYQRRCGIVTCFQPSGMCCIHPMNTTQPITTYMPKTV